MAHPTRLASSAYVDHLRADSARFRAVLSECDPAARVPACPGWEASDLLWHLSEVQWFWASVVSGRPAGPPADHPRRPPSYAELLTSFDDHSARLIEALAQADPAEQAWTWADEQTVGFSCRRQAHEALIHRLDAEQTAGVTPAGLDPALAADGVDELLEVMFGGSLPAWGRFEPVPGLVRLELVDTGHVLLASSGLFHGSDPVSGRSFDGPHVLLVDRDGSDPQATATITGAAADLDAWLWRRRDDRGIERSGDAVVQQAFTRAVGVALD